MPESRPLALPMLASAAVVGACFVGLSFVTYGLYDDYTNGVRPIREFLRYSVSDGRPVGGVLLSLSFGLTRPIHGLGAVRLVAVLLLACQTAGVTWILAKRLGSPAAAALISVVAHMTVGVQIVLAWGATLWVAVVASMLAGAGAYNIWTTESKRWVAWCGALAVIVGLSTYQPGGMASVGMIGLLVVTDSGHWVDVRRRLIRTTLWVGGAAAAYLVLWKLCESVVPKEGSRGGLSQDPLAKMDWFFDVVAVRMANPFSLSSFSWWSGAVVVLLVAAAPLGLSGGRGSVCARSVIALLTPICCYAPNLVVAESWASSRSLWVVLVVVVLLAGVGCFRLTTLASRRATHVRRFAAVAAVALVAVATVRAGTNSMGLVAEPNAAELRAVQAAMREMLAGEPSAIAIVPASYEDSIADGVSFDEFGYPASATSWAILPMVGPVVLASGFAGEVVVVDSVDSPDVPAGASVLELAFVLRRVEAVQP